MTDRTQSRSLIKLQTFLKDELPIHCKDVADDDGGDEDDEDDDDAENVDNRICRNQSVCQNIFRPYFVIFHYFCRLAHGFPWTCETGNICNIIFWLSLWSTTVAFMFTKWFAVRKDPTLKAPLSVLLSNWRTRICCCNQHDHHLVKGFRCFILHRLSSFSSHTQIEWPPEKRLYTLCLKMLFERFGGCSRLALGHPPLGVWHLEREKNENALKKVKNKKNIFEIRQAGWLHHQMTFLGQKWVLNVHKC